MVPKKVQLISLHKVVTSSDASPVSGELSMITDGDKEAADTSYIELHRRRQWVQIDLDANYAIDAIVLWHCHTVPQVYKDVIVQVAGDPEFTQNNQTIYNNDWDNSSGLGVGIDKEYFESYEGRLVDAKGIQARYVRRHNHSSTISALNRYTEVEIWGLPAR